MSSPHHDALPEDILPALRERAHAYRDAVIAGLQRLIAIPSVNPVGASSPGPEARAALRWMLEHAAALGFRVQNLDDIVGFVEYGPADAPEVVAVLAHLDVVPAGEGWTHPPFVGTIADGMIWGRGVEDDKGPAVSSLYALKALSDLGLPLRRRIRLILGTLEESGDWSDIRHYEAREGRPTMGFTPDAHFPVICGEKGILNVTFRAQEPAASNPTHRPGLHVAAWHAGSAPNIVPAFAWAALSLDARRFEPALVSLQRSARRFAQHHPESQLQVMRAELFRERYPTEELPAEAQVVVAARGQEAHGALPWDGHNALQDLANFLAACKVANNAVGRLAHFAARHLGVGWDGAGLGIAAEHDKLGPTTVNLGMARGDAQQASITLNVRLTPPHTVATLAEKLRRVGEEAGLQVEIDPASMNPLFVDEDDTLVVGLKRAYQLVTGRPAACAYIGGTTYAKAFPRMVAFGPLMPDEPMLAHQVDERVSLDSLVRNTEIYALALYFLAGA